MSKLAQRPPNSFDYTMPEHLDRLRRRGLGTNRTLAMQEFALGIEALERLVRREPLRRVHECVFGVLALESDYVGGKQFPSELFSDNPENRFLGLWPSGRPYANAQIEAPCTGRSANRF